VDLRKEGRAVKRLVRRLGLGFPEFAKNLKPPPTRPLTSGKFMLDIGANWTNSNSPRRKKFWVSAQSSPAPTEKPQSSALFCPALLVKEKNWHAAVVTPVCKQV